MSSLDLEAIRKQLESSKLTVPGAAETKKEKGAPKGSPLGRWFDGTKLGAASELLDVGTWIRDSWAEVDAVAPEEGGLLAGPGCEAAGGPPDRVQQVEDLEKATKGELEYSNDSALHCLFSMLFWVHQEAVVFQPNLSMGAAGQKTSSASEDRFQHMIMALNLVQQIARDVRSLPYSRYGREKAGLKDVSQFARKTAEEARKHAASLKEYVNNTMADSIGLSTGGG